MWFPFILNLVYTLSFSNSLCVHKSESPSWHRIQNVFIMRDQYRAEVLNCKTNVTKICYLRQRNTFTSRTQFMVPFFSVEFRYPFFFLKLLSKFSFQANSSFGSLGHIRAPSRSGRTGVTPGSGLFPASSPTDG